MTATTTTTGNEIDVDGDGVMGNEVDVDGDGATGDYNEDDDNGGGHGAMGSGTTGYDDDDVDDCAMTTMTTKRWRDDDDDDDDGDGATDDGIRRQRRRRWRRTTKTTRVVGAVLSRVGDLPVPRHAMMKLDGGQQCNNQPTKAARRQRQRVSARSAAAWQRHAKEETLTWAVVLFNNGRVDLYDTNAKVSEYLCHLDERCTK